MADDRSARNVLTIRIPEVAERLGIPRSTAYQWANEGRIPTIRQGRVLLVPVRALEEWIERQTQPGRA